MDVDIICFPVIPFTITMLAGFSCSFHSTCRDVVAGLGNNRTLGPSLIGSVPRVAWAFSTKPALRQKHDMSKNFRNVSKLDLFSHKKNTGEMMPVCRRKYHYDDDYQLVI
jgi:hypothetical protein